MAPELHVAVVDAKTSGNVGTIARAMKNFGVEQLLLVDPPAIGPASEAYGFAGRARDDILPNARELSFPELVEEFHTIGFTSTVNADDTKGIRHPAHTPEELADQLTDLEAKTALVFGRERTGLRNEELAQLDQLGTIPAHPDYPVLNLGQAATIVLYALRGLTLPDTQLPDQCHQRANEQEIEALHDHIETYLDRIDYPSERRKKALIMCRRLLGRSHPTSREVATIHGVMRESEHRLDQIGTTPSGVDE